MNKIVVILFTSVIILSNAIVGQTMSTIFRLLPPECTPDLNHKERKLLLQNGSYTIPGGDTTETQQYSMDTLHPANYLHYVYDYAIGPRGFNVFELRRFELPNGNSLIVFSRYGGAPVTFSQQDVKIFTFKNNKLIESKNQQLLPKEIKLDELLEKKTPDDVKKELSNNYNNAYNLDVENPDELEFDISFPYNIGEESKWWIYEGIVFKWNGHSFDKRYKKRG